MDCSEVLEQLSEFLNEPERAEMCRTIEAHLKVCGNCRFQVDTINKTIIIFRDEAPSEVPVTVSHQLQAALAREYSAKGQR